MSGSRAESTGRLFAVARAVATGGLWLAALIAWGCAGMAPPLTGLGQPRLTSFMGVSWGDEPADVEARYRHGSLETSPTGADAYRVDGVRADSVQYQTVLYEFVAGSGMQLVFARFAPESAGAVYDALKRELGKPLSLSGPETLGAARLEAVWSPAGSERVIFSGPSHRLTIVGPRGASLEEDIRMRHENED